MRISLVAALSENGVIGAAGDLPWSLPDDQRYFKRLTRGHCVVMGRRTFESLARPLPERTNIVLSRRPGFTAPGVVVAGDLETALDRARERDETEAFVVGGAAVYERALSLAHRLYLTRVHARVEGDVRFPDFEDERYGGWQRVEARLHPSDERHAYAFSFERWERPPAATSDSLRRS